MTIYVESNFILEIALGQEESRYAMELLSKAENGDITLAFPSFALSEPFATVTQRDRRRKAVIRSMTGLFEDFERSAPHRHIAESLNPVIRDLRSVYRNEVTRLKSTVKRILHIGRSIELDSASYQTALENESRYGLSPQDAIIYASIVRDLATSVRTDRSCFMSRNLKDFDDPDIRAELASYDCQYEESYKTGVSLVRKGTVQ